MHNRYPDNPDAGLRLDEREDQSAGAALDLDSRMHRGRASLWIRDSLSDANATVLLDLADLVALRNGINHIIDQEIT